MPSTKITHQILNIQLNAMDSFNSTSTKRTRDEILAEDLLSTLRSSSMLHPRQHTLPPATKDEERPHKKPRTAHKSTTDEPEAATETLIDASTVVFQKKKIEKVMRSTVASSTEAADGDDEDQKMSNAPTNDHDQNRDQPPYVPIPAQNALTPPAPFVPLAQVQARDLTKNKYAPTETAALQHYLNEVIDLQLHPARTPLQTPNSTLPDIDRHVIYERHFCGYNNEQCRNTYQAFGGKGQTDQAVSKLFLSKANIWYKEEGVVLPWSGRKKGDRERLRGLGLRPKNFPSPHDTKETAQKAKSKQGVVLRPNKLQSSRAAPQQALTMTTLQKKSDGSEVDSPTKRPHSVDFVTMQPLIYMDEEKRRTKHGIKTHVSEHDLRESEGVDTNQVYVEDTSDDEDEIIVLGKMSDRIRAAYNVFGTKLISINIGDEIITVEQPALLRHCGTARIETEEEIELTGCAGVSPEIIQAFVNAVSPFPGKRLPRHDYKFYALNNKQGASSEDVLGVMNIDRSETTKIGWNVNKLIELHRLCVAMDCAVVQDMIVDEIHQRYAKHLQQEGKPFAFEPLIEYMDELSSDDEDELLLKLLVDILLDQNNRGRPIPDNLADHVQEMVDARKKLPYAELNSTSFDELCASYHLHGKKKPCHQNRDHKVLNEKLICTFYKFIKQQASRADNIVTFSNEANIEGQADDAVQQTRQQELVLWSHEKGEETAKSLLKLEVLKQDQDLDEAFGRKIEKNYRTERKRHKHLVSTLQNAHKEKWKRSMTAKLT